MSARVFWMACALIAAGHFAYQFGKPVPNYLDALARTWFGCAGALTVWLLAWLERTS